MGSQETTRSLRRLLDEQGVKWEGGLPTETIVREPIDLLFVELPDNLLHLYVRSYLTPKQAINMALGSGVLTAEKVRECVEDVYLEGYNDGSVGRGAHLEETDWQSIADKLNSVRSCETCRNVHEPPKGTPFWPTPRFKCSECGATHVSMEYVYYCPNCGRKVVD